ncbi:bucentaur or craniofacial development-domain-containing protein [Whalleya microplaca]|nr:bucentaur or craniofacial development-domain-containing protein [Whalleya microplaca]
MSTEPIVDEDYASDEDSDFAPDAAPAEGASEASESENDEDDQPSAKPKRKRSDERDANANANADGDFENSGDEAIIHKGKKRQKKAKRDGDAGDDEGGEGGLIKTRSMRANEKEERKLHAVTGPVTIDVDDLWAKLTAEPLLPPKQQSAFDDGAEKTREDRVEKEQPNKSGPTEPPEMIKIKRTYNFAGKVHTEEKLVPRDSAEAKLYLASQDPKAAAEAVDAVEDGAPKRKPRKAFRSVFEPVIEGLAQRADLQLGMSVRLQLREQQVKAKAKKLNVVEKSRMDWAGFVDQEGIKDELELAGKSKGSYAHRQDFLGRVEAKREEEARRARVTGRG